MLPGVATRFCGAEGVDMMVPELEIVPELVNVLPAKLVKVPWFKMPVLLPVFDTVMVPELEMVPPAWFWMPTLPEFDTVMVPPSLFMLEPAPEFMMPLLLPVFDIVIVPPF